MVRLNTEKINLSSPYEVLSTQRPGTLEFFTKYGVHYSIDFFEDDLMLSATVYQFGIVNVNNVPSPRDWRVRDTIIAIIENFFLENNKAMLYICETGDGKQSMRDRLFHSWYHNSSLKNEVVLLSASIPDEEGIMNYTTLMVPIMSEDFEVLLSEFKTTISMFKNK